MKKLQFFLFCFLFGAQTLFAQGIVFQQGPFERVLKKAKVERKLVFLHLDNPNCEQCTEVATKGFSDRALTEKFGVNFVSYRVSGGSDEGKELIKRYELKGPLVSLFLHPDGSLIRRHNGSTSFSYLYLQEADKALAARYEKPLLELDKQYANGDRSLPFLKTYIDRRRLLNLPIDELLDTYVRQLPSDSLKAMSTFQFLFEQVPVLGTYADSVMRFDNRIWNERFFTYSLEKRIAFNRTLNQKTIQRAIENKNERLALKAALYNGGTYGNDRRGRQWAYESNLMTYYLGTKDTTMYLKTASRFYDTHLMALDPDSIKRVEQRKRMAMAHPNPGETQAMVSFGPPRTGQDLNLAAWRFWQLATKPEDLEKALTWSKRSLEYDERQSSWIDTYAHLLYKLGRREEAIREEERALAQTKAIGAPSASFERTLQQMKNGTLVPEVD